MENTNLATKIHNYWSHRLNRDIGSQPFTIFVSFLPSASEVLTNLSFHTVSFFSGI